MSALKYATIIAMAQENIVYKAEETPASNASKPNVNIPEEYLTDEYLYPTDTTPTEPSSKNPRTYLMYGIAGVFALLLIVVGVMFFMRRGSGGGAAGTGVQLTYWGLWDDAAQMKEIIADYKKIKPDVSIDYVVMDAKDSYRERLLARLQKGTGPDIMRIHNTWATTMTDILAPAPQGTFDAASYQKTYYPVVVKDCMSESNILCVPLGIDGLLLLYNKRLLANAGIAKQPTDWESLIEISRSLTIHNQDGQLQFGGVALGTAENITHYSDIIGAMLLQNGVSITQMQGDENAISVLETYTSFAQPPNDTWNETMDNSIVAFANEKVAMVFAPYWELEVIKHINPDIEIVALPMPQIQGGTQKAIANYWVEGVSKTSQHQTEAWEFLQYLSSKETLTKLAELDIKSGRIFPARPYPRINMANLITQDPYMGPVVQQAPYYDSLPFIDRTYDNGLNVHVGDYVRDAVNSIIFGSAPDEALTTLANGITTVIEQFKYVVKPVPNMP